MYKDEIFPKPYEEVLKKFKSDKKDKGDKVTNVKIVNTSTSQSVNLSMSNQNVPLILTQLNEKSVCL